LLQGVQAALAHGGGLDQGDQSLQMLHLPVGEVVSESVAQVPGGQPAQRQHGHGGKGQQRQRQGVGETQSHGVPNRLKRIEPADCECFVSGSSPLLRGAAPDSGDGLNPHSFSLNTLRGPTKKWL
jgi:hypothetical protein